MTLVDFVRMHVPVASARVLDVGCGRGDLALELAAAGFDVVAIDPEAPEGSIFRRITIEDFSDHGRFDVVIASRSLHHVGDVGLALDRISAVLAPGGIFVVNDFAWDRVDEATADWYYGQRAMVAVAKGESSTSSAEPPIERWRSEHGHLNRYREMRSGVDERFDEQHFSWEPYLYEELGGVANEGLERALIAAGAIQAIGFRHVGACR